MKLVVDANILFSAVLSKDGLVAETFHEAPAAFTLIAPSYITEELVRLRPKMAKSARKSLAEIEALQRWALARVKLVSEDVIGSCTKRRLLIRDLPPGVHGFRVRAVGAAGLGAMSIVMRSRVYG